MGTTVPLDADVESLLRKLMRERGLTIKEAFNQAVRAGLAGGTPGVARKYRLKTFRMGRADIALDKALSLAAAMKGEELTRRSSLRK
jgi:hypothetical protein